MSHPSPYPSETYLQLLRLPGRELEALMVGGEAPKLEDVVGARAKAFGDPANNVAQTMVQVAGLVMPELKVEISAVARI